jgi:uncharacterized protein YdeI (BOF family)
MKFLIVLTLAALSCQSMAFAETGAAEKFTSFVPLGQYTGTNDQVESCQVLVSEVNSPKTDIQVTVSLNGKSLSKLIVDGSAFSYKDYKREFIQTNRKQLGSDDTSYVEKIVRTVNAGDKLQYVTVSNSVVNNTDSKIESLDCVINL